jgi:rRNA-processing protein CGR1
MEQPSTLAASANGRLSRKPWKLTKSATVRTQSSPGHKTKWHLRMEKTNREHAVKKLELELKQEKQAEKQRKREITLQRQRASEERLRLEQEKAIMGARKAARLRRRAGRTKKING